jgi:hypothetical protein
MMAGENWSKPSKFLLSKKQARKFDNVSEVRISIWGAVPQALDDLTATQLWGKTRAETYYLLAMEKLRELDHLKMRQR